MANKLDSYVGGIVGTSEYVTIIGCSSSMEIHTYGSVGGICGFLAKLYNK